jgi:hypothetical protein
MITSSIALLFTFNSCSKDSTRNLTIDTLNINSLTGTGHLEITVRNLSYEDKTPSHCIISIYDKKNASVIQQQSISLTNLAEQVFISDPINLSSGYYSLKSCSVTDPDNNMLYKVMTETVFKIEKQKTTKIEPSLTAVYFNNTDSFFIIACTLDKLQKQYKPTSGAITLSTAGNNFYSGILDTSVNAILLPKKIDYFILTIQGTNGIPYKDSIPERDFNLYKRVYPYKAFLY